MGEKRKFFLTVEFQLIKIEGTIKTGHHQLANSTMIIALGKSYQRKLKSGGESLMKSRLFT